MPDAPANVRRDARPFLAHHLRRRGDERLAANGADIHQLARWVENLPSGDTRMARIEATDALNYQDGSVDLGPEAEALIDAWDPAPVAGGSSLGAPAGAASRDSWLGEVAAAVERHHLAARGGVAGR